MSHAMTVLPCGHVFDRHSLARHFASAQLKVMRQSYNARRQPQRSSAENAVLRCPLNCPCVAVVTLVTNSYMRTAVKHSRQQEGPRQNKPEPKRQQQEEQEEKEAASESALDASIFRTAENQAIWAEQLSDTFVIHFFLFNQTMLGSDSPYI